MALLNEYYICKSTTYWQCSRRKLKLRAFNLLFPSSFTEREISVSSSVITLFLLQLTKYHHMQKEYAYSTRMLLHDGKRRRVIQISGCKLFFFKLKGFPHKMRYFQYSVRDFDSVGTGQI